MKNDFVKVTSYWSPDEANLARIYLESNEIPCTLEGSELIRMAWLDANAVGGVKLFVQESDAEKAREILRHLPHIDEKELENESLRTVNDEPLPEESDTGTNDGPTDSSLLEAVQTLKPFVVFLFLLFPLLQVLFVAATTLAMILNIRVFS